MEGVGGVVTAEQLGPTGFEYARFREFMTREALAAIDAAKAAGATEIIVADAHGNGQNLLIDQFAPDVRIIRSWPRRLGMVAGLDETVDAVVFIGYHAGTNNPTGVRAHTFSSANLTRVALNGTNVTEGSWNAAIAGHFGVPVVMISGDDAAIAEVRKAIGPVESAETKRTLGFHSAITLTPQASAELIRERVRSALKRASRSTATTSSCAAASSAALNTRPSAGRAPRMPKNGYSSRSKKYSPVSPMAPCSISVLGLVSVSALVLKPYSSRFLCGVSGLPSRSW